MKFWSEKVIEMLDHMLQLIPQEINELDWKQGLSSNKERLLEHLAAFANLPGGGYLIFGIEDISGKILGVDDTFARQTIDKLANLARSGLEPEVTIDNDIVVFRGSPVLLIRIPESAIKPVHRRGKSVEETWIRCGGTTRKASKHDVGGLMLRSQIPRWEELPASLLLESAQAVSQLDHEVIAALLDRPLPASGNATLTWLQEEGFIIPHDGTGCYVSNLGAIAAARRLSSFADISRKSLRIIHYGGPDKLQTQREILRDEGYASGFEITVELINALLPQVEIIRRGLRTTRRVYPEIALRELIANALIHQDFGIRGTGPRIEIFSDRIEISNPGTLLPSKRLERLIGTQPESRNETLASRFRRYNICEERGTGIQKAISAAELYGLPPLRFTQSENTFTATLYAPKSFTEMSPSERLEATCQHAELRYLANGVLTNTSLRERFKVSERYRTQVSRIIAEAVAKGRLRIVDPESRSTKFAEYIPVWA